MLKLIFTLRSGDQVSIDVVNDSDPMVEALKAMRDGLERKGFQVKFIRETKTHEVIL